MRIGQLLRLEQELKEVELLLSESSLLRIESHGEPPTKYLVTAYCGGLGATEEGYPFAVMEHHFDIILPSDFPWAPPQVVWHSPILHPNINRPAVCLGDQWFGATTIAQICERLCEMAQLKSFNLYDPLNPAVAAWFNEKIQDEQFVLPIDTRPIRDLKFKIEILERHPGEARPAAEEARHDG